MSKWYRIHIMPLLFLMSCIFETQTEKPGPSGFVTMEIHLKPNPPALFKSASADTQFTLDTLKIIFSAPSTASVTYAYALTGNPDTGKLSVTTKVYTLAALRTWTAKIIALDISVNPIKTDTVYLDSVTFSVKPGDTAFVTKTANAAFSILRGRMVSNNPASVTHNVKWVRLRVDGVMRDSLPVGLTLWGIGFGNNSSGTAVGDSGTILRTTNSAVSWLPNASGTTERLNAVSFPSANTGFIVGHAGTVLKTTTGTTWVTQNSGTSQNLNGTHFSSSTSGYAVGDSGTIKISNGTNWSNPTTIPTQKDLLAVYAPSATSGFAVGEDGTILKTMNTGVVWSALSSTTQVHLRAVHFTSTTVGYAVGDQGTILKTIDGNSWSTLASGTTQSLRSVSFTNASTGYIVGEGGVLLRTTNASTWTVLDSKTVQDLNAIGWTANKSAGAIVGGYSTILRSTTGTAWTPYLYGSKSFDMLLTYKYLTPNISHTVRLDAIDTLSGPLRGYQVSKSILLSPGKDTIVTPTSSLEKCGYVGFANCL